MTDYNEFINLGIQIKSLIVYKNNLIYEKNILEQSMTDEISINKKNENIEENKKNINKIQEQINNYISKRLDIIINVKKEYKKVNTELDQINIIIKNYKCNNDEEEYLIKIAKLMLLNKKEEIYDDIVNLLGKTNSGKLESVITPCCVTRMTSDIIMTRSNTHLSNYNNNTDSFNYKSSSHMQSNIHEQNNLVTEYFTKIEKCPICLDNPATLIAFNCGHVIACSNPTTGCMEFIELFEEEHKCPICRAEFNKTIPLISIILTKNGIKCQRCIQNKHNITPASIASNILECGHLGYCLECKKKTDEKSDKVNNLYSCYECNIKKNALCNVYFA